MVIIDVFLILDKKNNIESKMDGVVTLYRKGNTNEIKTFLNKDLDNVTYNLTSDEDYTYIEINLDYDFITPGLDNILGHDFIIKTERVILNEE